MQRNPRVHQHDEIVIQIPDSTSLYVIPILRKKVNILNISYSLSYVINMTVFSLRIPEDLKKKMESLSNINWSEEIRFFLSIRIQEEIACRNIDPMRLERAVKSSNELKKIHIAEENWDSTQELKKWRDQRR